MSKFEGFDDKKTFGNDIIFPGKHKKGYSVESTYSRKTSQAISANRTTVVESKFDSGWWEQSKKLREK